MTGPDDEMGINGGLLQRQTPGGGAAHGSNAFVCTIQVEDYDATETRIVEAGGIHQEDPNAA